MRGCVGTIYKFGLTVMFLIGLFFLLGGQAITGIIFIAIAVLLFGSQVRRDQRWRDERHHKELLAAMQANQQGQKVE